LIWGFQSPKTGLWGLNWTQNCSLAIEYKNQLGYCLGGFQTPKTGLLGLELGAKPKTF
jgi:hypothetical protein